MIKKKKLKGVIFLGVGLILTSWFLAFQSMAQEDKIVQTAINTVKIQLRLSREVEVRFVEKKDSPLPDFYTVKLILFTPDKEIPLIVYVDKTGEKVFIGNLIIKGKNVTAKDAGPPKPRKVDMAQLEIEKSPSRGPSEVKLKIVEFSNFECPYCQMSWVKMKEWVERHPKDIQYVFKHFPFQSQGKPFDLSEMAAAAQAISNEAFWIVHDFLFSNEGQALLQVEKDIVRQRIEQLLKEKGNEVSAFQIALETGQGRRRVEEDMVLGKNIRVTGTPTILINGEFVANPLTDQVLERYLRK